METSASARGLSLALLPPTSVTHHTRWREHGSVSAWPLESGLEKLLHAKVSCLPISFLHVTLQSSTGLEVSSENKLICQIPALECPELDAPENGEVELSGRVAGTTATYTCDDGFVLVGSAVRTCQGNGFWTGATPLCQRE